MQEPMEHQSLEQQLEALRHQIEAVRDRVGHQEESTTALRSISAELLDAVRRSEQEALAQRESSRLELMQVQAQIAADAVKFEADRGDNNARFNAVLEEQIRLREEANDLRRATNALLERLA